jgi:hypothetical protein
MSFSERRERSDRRQGDRRRPDSADDLYTRLKEKRAEIERERRSTPRRQADRRTTPSDPPSPNAVDQAQRWAENPVENPTPGPTRKTELA